MFQLAADAYGKVRGLFPEPHLRPIINAAIDGNSPARIWADNPDHPAAVYMWDGRHCHYLLGAAGMTPFNEALAALIAGTIAPEAVARGAGFAKLYYDGPAWEGVLPAIYAGHAMRQAPRVFYEFLAAQPPDWRTRLQQDCRVVPIDADILAGRLGNSSYVIDEIASGWPILERFQRYGFGFCLLHGDEIACWCTAEYRSGSQCGIGIETVEMYQRRGYATITGSAFVEHCVQEGITPHWDAWARNAPSVLAAERIGFEKAAEYSIFVTDLAEGG